MIHQESTFQGVGGYTLFSQSWLPEGKPTAVLIIIHGVGEHSGRYHHVVDYFVPLGYAIYSYDQRGHGRSPGKRGHVNDFSEFRHDVRTFVNLVKTAQPERPLFIMGHSLGGLISLDYVLHHPQGLSGAIISAPALGDVQLSPALLTISRILSRLTPGLLINGDLETDKISRIPAEISAYQNDPLVHGKGSPRIVTEVEKTNSWVMRHAADWQVPLLMYHGDADAITQPQASRQFFDQITFPDKQYISYPGGYHESHNDLHKEQTFADIKEWLAAHLPAE